MFHHHIIIMSDSDSETITSRPKLFGRQRPIRSVLGGGEVADLLLWKHKTASAALLAGLTVIWFLFEVVEYNFVTLFCHIAITAMLFVFIWCNAAEFFNWNPPRIPESITEGSTYQELASIFHSRCSKAMSKLLDIACGKDPALFLLVIVSFYILSVIGNYLTFLNFLYFGYVCLQTLPFLYDKYEEEVDFYLGEFIGEVKRRYRTFDSTVLNKIPRGPVKEKKIR